MYVRLLAVRGDLRLLVTEQPGGPTDDYRLAIYPHDPGVSTGTPALAALKEAL